MTPADLGPSRTACPYCPDTGYLYPSGLRRHYDAEHPRQPALGQEQHRRTPCPYCAAWFFYLGGLRHHLDTDHTPPKPAGTEAWTCDYATDHTGVHIRPIADFIAHPLDADCVCGPVAFHVPIDGADLSWIYLHHALDGRQQAQEGVMRPHPADDA